MDSEFKKTEDEDRANFYEIKRRWAKSTPGPWKLEPSKNNLVLLSREEDSPFTSGPFVLDNGTHYFSMKKARTMIAEIKSDPHVSQDDMEFLVNSWGDIHFLVNRVEELEETLAFINGLRITETDKLRAHSHQLLMDNKTLADQVRFDAHWIHRVLTLEEENKGLRARLGE